MGFFQRIRSRVREIMGRVQLFDVAFMQSRAQVVTWDQTRTDYNFWDSFRRGKAKGFSLGSLFAQRIEHVFSAWTFGSGFEIHTADRHEYTDKLLTEFVRSILDTGAAEDQDVDVIVNADGTLSVPAPNTVNWILNPIDYRIVDAVEIINKTPKYTIVDRYERFVRIITVKAGAEIVSTQVFDNLLGRIPIIHLSYGRGRNEIYGHPIHEPLRVLYDQYDNLLFKQIDGGVLLGNPILAFTGLEDLSAVMDANKPTETEQYVDRSGNVVDRPQLKIDSSSALLIGKGGDAKFVGPSVGFSKDTETGLRSLFMLLLYHTGIPEFAWGGEMASARASSETQQTQWVRDIEAVQRNNGGWIIGLASLWLATKKLTDRRVNTTSAIRIRWSPVDSVDINLLLKKLEFGMRHGVLTRLTTLRLLSLVERPEEEVASAKLEADAAMAEAAAAELPNDPGEVEPGGKKPGSSTTVR
jgi:hypothetical protein